MERWRGGGVVGERSRQGLGDDEPESSKLGQTRLETRGEVTKALGWRV